MKTQCIAALFVALLMAPESLASQIRLRKLIETGSSAAVPDHQTTTLNETGAELSQITTSEDDEPIVNTSSKVGGTVSADLARMTQPKIENGCIVTVDSTGEAYLTEKSSCDDPAPQEGAVEKDPE